MHKQQAPKALKKVGGAKKVVAAKKSTLSKVQKVQKRDIALADIKARVTSVRNIGKLTKALQLVATAQLRTARRQLEESRRFAAPIMESWELPGPIDTLATKPDMTKGKEHIIAFATDRSLCGSVNSQMVKAIRPLFSEAKIQDRKDLALTVLGEKGRSGLEREYGRFFANIFTDISKCKELTFKQSLAFTDTLLKSEAPHGAFHYNYFTNAMAFEPRRQVFVDTDTMVANTHFTNSHSWQRDHENYKNYHEMLLSASMFNFWAENVAVEIATRMSAMSMSSTNADEIAFLLNRFYNRTRQAKITSELIEINSGMTVVTASQD